MSFIRSKEELKYLDYLSRFCHQIHTLVLTRSRLLDLIYFIRSLLTSIPFMILRDSSKEMKATIDGLLENNEFDVIHVDQLNVAQYVNGVSASKKVLDEHNVVAMNVRSLFETTAFVNPKKMFLYLEWLKLRRYETNACRKFDAVMTVTEQDKKILQSCLPSKIRLEVIPIGVDLNEFTLLSRNNKSKVLVYMGTMYYQPNIEGIMWFCRNIYPLIKKEVPDIKLLIIGSRPPTQVQKLEFDESIHVLGYVDDIMPYMHDCAVAIVPLRAGSGMRVKILNFLAMGIPVVSTSLGCEGINTIHGENIVIADEPYDFAKGVVALLCDENLAEKLTRQGRRLVEDKYSWDTIFNRLDEIYQKIENMRN